MRDIDQPMDSMELKRILDEKHPTHAFNEDLYY